MIIKINDLTNIIFILINSLYKCLELTINFFNKKERKTEILFSYSKIFSIDNDVTFINNLKNIIAARYDYTEG